MLPVAVLVVAKAPVPGLAKTRLAAGVGPAAAADIAAASLLDTLDAVAAAPVAARVVALTGDLGQAVCRDEIRDRLRGFTVVAQRGADFGHRLANAHVDAAHATGLPVLQIGMDTPQVTADLLARTAEELLDADAVLGLAHDGGWWVLGVTGPAMADCLRAIPTSRSDTGMRTLKALQDKHIDVRLVAELGDVDTIDDIEPVRQLCAPDSRFAHITSSSGSRD
ncbi:TIGR04282 family arsenosugar biosynthesis glycosyltransferase [Mycolicibacterium sp. XJ870]